MRIVAVADTHGRERALGPLPEGNLLIYAGDLLQGGSIDELEAVGRWLAKLPFQTKVVVAGNSDWCFLTDPVNARSVLGDDVVYLQDQAVTIEGLTVWGSPWQPEYKAGAFNLPRGDCLVEKWELVPSETDILITHSPPRGIGDRTPVGNIGCDDLLSMVRRVRPALHCFGHAHADGGVWRSDGICFANVTTWAGSRPPTVLDIDPVNLAVTEISVPPAN